MRPSERYFGDTTVSVHPPAIGGPEIHYRLGGIGVSTDSENQPILHVGPVTFFLTDEHVDRIYNSLADYITVRSLRDGLEGEGMDREGSGVVNVAEAGGREFAGTSWGSIWLRDGIRYKVVGFDARVTETQVGDDRGRDAIGNPRRFHLLGLCGTVTYASLWELQKNATLIRDGEGDPEIAEETPACPPDASAEALDSRLREESMKHMEDVIL